MSGTPRAFVQGQGPAELPGEHPTAARALLQNMPLASRRQRDGPWPALEDRSMPVDRLRSDIPARVTALQHLRYLVRAAAASSCQ